MKNASGGSDGMGGPGEFGSASIARLEALAEAAYGRMYDATGAPAAAGCYAEAKDWLHDAMALARQSDDRAAMARIAARLGEIKAVFRSQFS